MSEQSEIAQKLARLTANNHVPTTQEYYELLIQESDHVSAALAVIQVAEVAAEALYAAARILNEAEKGLKSQSTEQLREVVVRRENKLITRSNTLLVLSLVSEDVGSETINTIILEEDGELLLQAIHLAAERGFSKTLRTLIVRAKELLEEPTQVPLTASDEQVEEVMKSHDASFLGAALKAIWKVSRVSLRLEEITEIADLLDFYCLCLADTRRFVVVESAYGLVVLYSSFPFLRKDIVNKVESAVFKKNFFYARLIEGTFTMGSLPSEVSRRAAAAQLQILIGWADKYEPPS